MKRIAAILSFLPVLAMATSLHPDTFNGGEQVADLLHTLSVANVEEVGSVLKTSGQHPYSDFLIGIPVQVETGSACTQFVGQETIRNTQSGPITLRAVGANNPMTDACIAVMPMPVKTQLTFKMRVLTGGFVPAQRYHTQAVKIQSGGYYNVTLDLYESRVKIAPARIN